MHEELDTAGKPYTAIVLATLILMRHHFPAQTRIRATGCTAAEWRAASNHIAVVTGAQTLPPELATICQPTLSRGMRAR